MFGTSFEVSHSQNLRAQLINWVLNRLMTNAYVLSEESMQDFTAKLIRHRPCLLMGYTSSIFHFARFLRENPAYDLIPIAY